MKYINTAILAVAASPFVAGHGLISSPTPRKAGTAMKTACGEQIYNNQAADPYGNVQGEQQLIQADFTSACNLWICKGFQYSDNTANVQNYKTGQVVPIKFDLRAPHTGVANVSVVDTATGSVIGQPLASWSVFASNSAAHAANESDFSVTIPDLAGKCTKGGECVIQHYWNAASIDQTYESCIDFTVGASSAKFRFF